MSGSIFSPSWYRVAELTPRIRSHARIIRQLYRGQVWYVLQDLSTEQFYRFSPAGYVVIGLMDGRRTVHEIWELATDRLGDDAPTQDETIHLLSQLHAADVLQCDVPPDVTELLERHESVVRRRWQSNLFSVMAWRIPLFDPERFLKRLLPLVRPFLSWFGALLWLAVVVPGVTLAIVHWTDLTHNLVDRVLAPQSLALIWLLYPMIKGLHEFGHAFVTKEFGGEVHDMGVMILVLTPVPYVDASAAWAFREKWRRSLVGAAGVIVELFIAAVAVFIWLNVQPGPVRTLAYNAMIIAGVSTLLFNGNPLLRFDGYYVLADVLEIPNLRARANIYVGYLAEHYLLGRRDAERPAATPGEQAWFVIYTVASFVYRVFIVFGIIFFIARKFFIVGVILALMFAAAWTVVPLAKGVVYLVSSPRIRSVRARAIAMTVVMVAVVVSVVALVPMPLRSRAEGIIWIPDEAFVRAATDGVVDRVAAQPGARVRRGDVLIVCHDLVVATEVRMLEARLREMEARYAEQQPRDRVKAAMIKEEMRYVRESLAKARRRAADLIIRSRADGVLVVPSAEDLPGRFVRQGQLLAYVVKLDTIAVRSVVSQANIDLVRQRTVGVEVRPAERIARTIPAVIRRIVPAALERLPSTALGRQGGGQIAVDPTDPQGVTAIEKQFQVDLELRDPLDLVTVGDGGPRYQGSGGRVYVRFDHGSEPLAGQWYRRVRRLFLSRFHV